MKCQLFRYSKWLLIAIPSIAFHIPLKTKGSFLVHPYNNIWNINMNWFGFCFISFPSIPLSNRIAIVVVFIKHLLERNIKSHFSFNPLARRTDTTLKIRWMTGPSHSLEEEITYTTKCTKLANLSVRVVHWVSCANQHLVIELRALVLCTFRWLFVAFCCVNLFSSLCAMQPMNS